MTGINKCLSVKVCILLTWFQSSWKPFEVYNFRWVWKFYWDLSNVISGGNWLLRLDCVFSGETLYTPLRTMFKKYVKYQNSKGWKKKPRMEYSKWVECSGKSFRHGLWVISIFWRGTYVNFSVHPSVLPSVRPSFPPSICPSVCPSILPSVVHHISGTVHYLSIIFGTHM